MVLIKQPGQKSETVTSILWHPDRIRKHTGPTAR